MTIEERLKAIGPTEVDPKSQKRTVPKADNMAVLLEQGLASGDKTILNVCAVFWVDLYSFSLLVFNYSAFKSFFFELLIKSALVFQCFKNNFEAFYVYSALKISLFLQCF